MRALDWRIEIDLDEKPFPKPDERPKAEQGKTQGHDRGTVQLRLQDFPKSKESSFITID